jgi:uncharacterized membrane protein YqgA involved in biofilm formation
MDGLGILVLALGIQYTFEAENVALVGLCLALGGGLGEWWQWEAKLEQGGRWLQRRLPNLGAGFAQAFVSTSLVFCVGAMSILGSLEDGLTGDPQILLIKSMLDGVFSLIFAASMGIGVLFSAFPVLLYQGLITWGAEYLQPFFTEALLNNVVALGGILIAAIGLNLLKLTNIRVANLLPGIFLLPAVMLVIEALG